MSSDTPWTDAKIARLTQLWAEGLATAEISRRLNLSKNAVVGKAHRLRLPERPSPIKPREGGQPHRIAPAPPPGRHTGRPTLPRLACLQRPLAAAAATPDRALLPSPNLEASALGMPLRPRATHPCCWPLGEPGSPRFRYCDEPVMAGKPYCEAHCRLAYVRGRAAAEELCGRPGEGR
jgi:GcrA cell cycle regulator